MKRLVMIVVLMLFALMARAEWVVVDPYVNTRVIADCVTATGSDTVWATAKPFNGVSVGDKVWGVGVPAGTTVEALVNADLDSGIVLSNTMTVGGQKYLTFGYYVSTAVRTYATGEWAGMITEIPYTPGQIRKLKRIVLLDGSDTGTAVDIIFYTTFVDSGATASGRDSSTADILATDWYKVFYVASMTSPTDLGGVDYYTLNGLDIGFPRKQTYLRLWAKGALGPGLDLYGKLKVLLYFED